MKRFLLVAALLLWPITALAQLGDGTPRTISANETLTSADCNKTVYINGPLGITLPAPSSFGACAVLLKKIDIAADAVRIYPNSGTFEEGRSVLWMCCEGDGVLMKSDGVSGTAAGWKVVLAGGLSALRCGAVKGEHVVTTNNSVHPWDCGFTYFIDPCQMPGGPASVYLALPSVSDVAFNHIQFHIRFKRIDSCDTITTYPNLIVSIVSNSAGQGFGGWPGTIGDAGGGVQKIDMTANYQVLELQSDGNAWHAIGWNGWSFP